MTTQKTTAPSEPITIAPPDYLGSGFSSAITEASATPATDGYIAIYGGHPYHIHPTATPDVWALLQTAKDAGELTIAPYAAPASPTQEEVRLQYEGAAQNVLDSTAQSWGYDSLISAASYASSGVAQYKADAQALITWRDALWQKAFSIENDVKAGTIPMPATAADFLAMLPSAPARPTA